MTRCIIVDDEPLARSLIEGYIGEIPFLECIGSFKNAVLAADFLSKNEVDIIFLDIQMPKLTGIDFLRSLKHPPKVIFTTAYREYAVESYELQVLDYLLKPITFTRFFQAINKWKTGTSMINNIKETVADHIFVQLNKKHVKILVDDILYVESLRDYLKIHLKTGTLIIKERISVFAKTLSKYNFLQVHRSYIVALDKITAFTQQDIEIGKVEIPIGGVYKELVLGILKD